MPRRPTVVVLGASGFLGVALTTTLEGRASVISGGRGLVDVTDAGALRSLLGGAKASVVVNAAAVIPRRGDAAAMWRVNAEGAGLVAATAAEVGARLVHVSTDVVHDGMSGPYADDATPSPVGDYPASKA